MDEHEFVLNFGALLPGYEVTGFRRLHGYRIAKSSTYLAISISSIGSQRDSQNNLGSVHCTKEGIVFLHCTFESALDFVLCS